MNMMMSALSQHQHSHSSKARANSADDRGCSSSPQQHESLDYDYSLQRASSSEALLPSQYQYHDNNNNNNNDDNIHYCSSSDNEDDNSRYNSSHSSQNGSSFTPTRSSTETKRLQTIESGISLAESANQQAGQSLPKPPLHSPVLPPPPHIMENNKPDMIQRDTSHQSQLSTISHYSYYSVDAGKHGFINHGNHNGNYNNNDDGEYDNDSIANDSMSNGSLVFKYQPGRETPPAEYALPASILRVYGETPASADVEQGNKAANTRMMAWHRPGTESTGGSQGSIFFTHSADDSDETNENEARNGQGGNYKLLSKKPSRGSSSPRDCSPGGSPKFNNGPSLRIPHLMGAAATLPSSGGDNISVVRILPYHERKRLMELEEEEKKRTKTAKGGSFAKGKANKSDKGKSGGAAPSKSNSEKTPLTSKQRSNGSYYGASETSNSTNSTDNSQDRQEQQQQTVGWFGQLVSIVTGATSPIEEERDNNEEHHQEGSMQQLQDEEKAYRNKGRAFLKKTENERMKMKEQRGVEKLNNVIVPVKKQSFGPHRARMSSMSAALDSIASISEDDEEEESSDEESGSYFIQQEEKAPAARVWKYGEPATNTTTTTPCSKMTNSSKPCKKKKATTPTSKQHDRIMRRERLMQEEYEYRLHVLKRENEKLSKRFRVFVLVAVALIFTGALAFAFVICVRMLMSI